MNKLLAVLTFLSIIVLNTSAKDTIGIRFEKGLTWNEIKHKARTERKYIFMDCYATWCGPCKWMDKTILTGNKVGEFFNSHFINVKVQMDQTTRDSIEIRRWYTDAKEIRDKYSINLFPLYLFFDPNGNVVHRYAGTVENEQQFIEVAKEATSSQSQYYTNILKYKDHQYDSAYLRESIISALKIGDRTTAGDIGTAYLKCIRSPYISDNINLIRKFTNSSDHAGFDVLKNDAENSLDSLGRKNSINVIRRIIFKEEIEPVISDASKDIDWTKLSHKLSSKYRTSEVDYVIAQNRLEYFLSKGQIPQYESAYLKFMERFGGEFDHYYRNAYAWDAFQSSGNKYVLEEALKWSRTCLEAKDDPNYMNYIDTYANILYKLNDRNNAVIWERRALQIAIKLDRKDKIKEFSAVLKKMENNSKTWE